jgi:NADH-quinone oxidoreductase subunit J
MTTVLFYMFGGIALLAAISVVAQKKVFYSALSLVVCLCAISAEYLLLEAPFIAAVQVIVYAGAIMVLFLFVIMLLDPFSAAVLRDKKKYLKYLAILLGAFALALLYPILNAYNLDQTPKSAGSTEAVGSIRNVGLALFNQYLLPFEITSVLILIAIIGVVVLARRKS